MPDGQWKKIIGTVRFPWQLQEAIERLKPSDVYHSTCYYLSPDKVGPDSFIGLRSGYEVADNLLIDGDLWFDIDAHDRPLQDAHAESKTLKKRLQDRFGYEVHHNFTGRGFQEYVTEHGLKLDSASPRERLLLYRASREDLIEQLADTGIRLDSEVTLSPKSVVRVVGTPNGHNGFIATEIDDLDKFDVKDVERVPLSNGTLSPVTSPRHDEPPCLTGRIPCSTNPRHDASHLAGRMTRFNSISKLTLGSLSGRWLPARTGTPTIKQAVSTVVAGTVNRETLLLTFDGSQNLDRIFNRLEAFVSKEKLAPFFIFESHTPKHMFYAFSPTAVEWPHLRKLLKRRKSDFAAYMKFTHRFQFGHRFLPFPLLYLGKTETPLTGKEIVSYAHSRWLQSRLGTEIHGVKSGSSIFPLRKLGYGERQN